MKIKIRNIALYLIIVALVMSSVAATVFVLPEMQPRDVIAVSDSDLEGVGYNPQDAATEIGLYANQSYAEVGDNFNVTCYLNPGGETVTAWYIWNLTYNYDTSNMITCNNITIPGFWHTGFQDEGDIFNTTDNISGVQSFDVGGTSNNYTAFRMNFTANTPGTVYMNFSADGTYSTTGVQISAGGGPVTNHTVNMTFNIYPQDVSSFTATTYNYTAINLSWVKGTGDDNVTVCGKTGSYPTGPSDSVIYNGSNLTYNHTSLDNCTTYYYRAWGWNATTNMHSIVNDSATATTSCYTNFTFTGITPTNDSKTANCTYDSIAFNLTVINSNGVSGNLWINQSDGAGSYWGATQLYNQSFGNAFLNVDHNTTYWWNVTASAGGDTHIEHYHLRTGEGGGTAPAGSNSYPNGQTGIAISPTNYAVKVTDADSDPTNVSFFFSDGTFIGNHNMTYSGNTANVTWSTALATNTTYQWYALLNDTSGCATSTRYPSSGFFSFTTQEALVAVTKEWMVHANNTLQIWINVTNNGEFDLADGYINETWDYDNLNLVGANWTANGSDPGMYNITWLNVSNSSWLTMFFSLSGPVENGTSFSDTATVYFNGTALNADTPATLPTVCFYATKEANRTSIDWNDTSTTFWINVTNCGDFYLNWTQMNETYSANLSYDYSNYPPAGATNNQTFNLTQLAPGATNTTMIRMNKTAAELINGSLIWNNITIHSNQTVAEEYFNNSWFVGARTERIRVVYSTVYYDVLSTSNSIFQILGVVLMIGAILAVVWVLYLNKQSGGWD